MEALKAHLDEGLLVEHDEDIHGPLIWLLYRQFIEKPNQPGVFRVVGDFGPLNDRIVKDCYNIQTVDQIWKQVEPDSKQFFVCDATSSYNQIENTASTERLMAIALPTSEGTKYIHFKTVGMGCSNSGPVWCRASDAVL